MGSRVPVLPEAGTAESQKLERFYKAIGLQDMVPRREQEAYQQCEHPVREQESRTSAGQTEKIRRFSPTMMPEDATNNVKKMTSKRVNRKENDAISLMLRGAAFSPSQQVSCDSYGAAPRLWI